MLTKGNIQIEQACWLVIVNSAALVPAVNQVLIVADSLDERVANVGAITPIVPLVYPANRAHSGLKLDRRGHQRKLRPASPTAATTAIVTNRLTGSK